MAKTLTVYLAADVGKFRRDLANAESGMQGFAGSLKNLVGPALIGATAAAGAFAIKLAADGVKAAMDDEASLKSLAQTLNNVGKAHDQPAIEEFIYGLERSLGVADTELRPAYDRLVRSTNDVAEANKALQIALDVSAGTGKSLAAVTEALGKAYDGNTVGLSRLGAGLDRATLSAGNLEQINGELTRIFAGQATTAANTYEGQVKRLDTAVDNLFETMAGNLLKALGDTNDATQDIVDAFEDAEQKAGDLTYGIGVLIGELIDLNKATKDSGNSNKSWIASFGDFVREQAARNDLLSVTGLTIQAIGAQAQVAAKYTDDLNTAWADYRRAQQGVVKASPELIEALNDTADAAQGAALSGAAAARALLETAIATGQVPEAARWAQRFDVAEMLSNIGKLEKTTGGLASTVTERGVPAMDRMTLSIKDQLGALTEQVGKIDAAAKALDGYALSIQQGVLGGIDLGAVFNPEDAATTIDAYTKQITDVTAFSESLAALGASLPNTPGAQLLLQQILGEGYKGGQAFIDGLTTETATNLVGELDKAITAVEGNSYLLANKFYGEGVEAAQQTFDGMIAQILKDEKKLRDIGKAIGKPIGANIKAEIAASVAEAVAAAQAAGEAARAEAGAREAARQATLTEQAIAADLARLIRNSDARAGRNVNPVVR